MNTGIVPDLQQSASANYSDLKPNNILLSGIQTGHVIAKVGDLGLGDQAVVNEARFY